MIASSMNDHLLVTYFFYHFDFMIKSGPTVGLGRTGSDPNALGSIQYSTLVTMHTLCTSAIERVSSKQTRKNVLEKLLF